jgi:TPR repeat protein
MLDLKKTVALAAALAAVSPACAAPATGLSSLEAAATKGDPSAQDELGTAYAEGRGTNKNLGGAI